jgi:hypothetical protein
MTECIDVASAPIPVTDLRVRGIGSGVAFILIASVAVPAAIVAAPFTHDFHALSLPGMLVIASVVGAPVGAILGWRATPVVLTSQVLRWQSTAVLAAKAVLLGDLAVSTGFAVASVRSFVGATPEGAAAATIVGFLGATLVFFAAGLAYFGIPSFVFAVVVVRVWEQLVRRFLRAAVLG